MRVRVRGPIWPVSPIVRRIIKCNSKHNSPLFSRLCCFTAAADVLACVCVYLSVERLVTEGCIETSDIWLSEVVSALSADGDRDVRYFIERVTPSLMSMIEC